jgi:ATP adenylyltransferase
VERLWSPWRLKYVTGAAGSDIGCVFCSALQRADAEPLILYRGSAAFAILNLFPYNNGHLMVVPNRHVPSLAALSDAELTEVARLTRVAEMAVEDAYHPQGMNIGVNLGRAAGAGIVDHVHVHLVPRWTGDTNFMSVVGETRVLPEALEDTAKRLRPAFERLMADEHR